MIFAAYIDIQGYKTGRLHAIPEYLPEYMLYRISYAIQQGNEPWVEFGEAYRRAYRMTKKPRDARLLRKMRDKTKARRESGRHYGYKRRLRKADRLPDVPPVSQSDKPPG